MSTNSRITKQISNSKIVTSTSIPYNSPKISSIQTTRINATASRAIRLSHIRPDLFQHGNKSSDIINNNLGISYYNSSNDEKDPGFVSNLYMKASYTKILQSDSPRRPSTAGSTSNRIKESSRNIQERPGYATRSRKLFQSLGKVDLPSGLLSSALQDIHPNKTSQKMYLYPTLSNSPTPSINELPWIKSKIESSMHSIGRPRSAPPNSVKDNEGPIFPEGSSQLGWVTSCLKKDEFPRSYRQSVTFAPDTLHVDRESKPKKLRLKNNRKPKFAHPCCGHFLPPQQETIPFVSSASLLSDNQYTKYTSIWCGPMSRVSHESISKKSFRHQRLRNILHDLSYAHETFNQLPESQKAKLMIEQIIPRYISALDIALMDSELDHVQQLLTTIISSLRILQINLHDLFFESNGKPKNMRQTPFNQQDLFEKIAPVVFAMNRIAAEQVNQEQKSMHIEPELVKLQLELLILTICPFDCVIFRGQLSMIPSTAEKALDLLKQVKERRFYYCVKWVTDSVMHRDYLSILKYFGFCDETGAKNPVPLRHHQQAASKPKFSRSATATGSDHQKPIVPNNGFHSRQRMISQLNSDPDLTEYS